MEWIAGTTAETIGGTTVGTAADLGRR